MAPLALFGIGNDAVNLALGLLLLFLGALWLALVWWTYMDARRRVEDGLIVSCAVAASTFFPFIGTIVYLIVRPPEYLDDVRERELEMAAAEARLHQFEGHACPYCDFSIEPSFLRCPSCLRRLKEPCQTCAKPLDPRWKICPYCESEIPGASSGQGRQRQRPAAQAQQPTRATQPAGRPRQAAPAGTRPSTPAGGGAARPAQPRQGQGRPAQGGQPAARPAQGGQPAARPQQGQPAARPAAPRPGGQAPASPARPPAR